MMYGTGSVGKNGKNHARVPMAVLLIAVLAMGVFAAQADAAVWFVKSGKTGDGTSWANAGGSIQTVVNYAAAAGGGEIWVAAGTYVSTASPVVTMIAGVDLYGGFAGTETDRASRDWVANLTVIDGQKGRYCVKGITGATIDGFTLQNGSGTYGGMYNANASPTIGNCVFSKNTATGNGGGMYNDSSSLPTVTNCTFTANTSSAFGGGIYTLAPLSLTGCTFSGNAAVGGNGGGGGGISASASLSVTDCTFTGNTATGGNECDGGGIWSSAPLSVTHCTFAGNTTVNGYYHSGGGGVYSTSASLSVRNCTFTGNSAGGSSGGAGICCLNCNSSSLISNCVFSTNKNPANGGGGGVSLSGSPTITGCTFTGNTASGSYGGGGIYSSGSPSITSCTFTGNTATSSGGGIYSSGSPSMSSCDFTGNTATSSGGGVCFTGSPTITLCTFTGNTTSGSGGGLYSTGSPSITGCAFTLNTSTNGGGIYSTAQITASACNILQNTATSTSIGGGGMYLGGGSSTLINCVFALNNSCYNGGGLYNASSTPTLKNCTFSANQALYGGNGGAIYNDGSSSSRVTSGILWEDTGYVYSGNEIYDTSTASTVIYSCIQYGWSGTNNITSNPLFVDPADGDCRLIGGSACIDAALADSAVTTDLLGTTRGTKPDMGAYEYTGTPAAAFGVSATSGAAPLTVEFVDRSSGGSGWLTGWSWDFGDGTTGTDENPTHTYTNAGSYTVILTVTGSAGTNVNTKTNFITVTTTTKTIPTVSVWPTASSIHYGQMLSASALSGAVPSVDGAFTFAAPATVPEAGTFVAPVTFTPTNTTLYTTVAGVVSVTVNKVTPTVSTWPTASAIIYGQTLASSALSGGTASVPGKFVFDAPSAAPATGAYTASITFTPTDTTDYNTVSNTVSVTVNKATPAISAWPTATGLTYGQALSSSALSGGTASVAGTFAFVAPSTVPGAGTYTAALTFTPTDTTDYNTVSGSVSVAVSKATPVISPWPAAGAITYGQTLASSTLSGGTASAAGVFAFVSPSTAPSAGTYTAAVTFTPTDTADYNTVSGTVQVTVNKATPTISAWPTASALIYGQTLANSTLSGGTASVAGTFAFDTPSTAPVAGSYTASVTFTPANSANYNTVAGTVAVAVSKATPTISAWPTAGALVYGQTLADSALSGGTALVDGIFAFAAPSTAPGAGAYPASVTFTPADTGNYNVVSSIVSVAVAKATPVISPWPTAAALTYGQTLANSTLDGGTASVAGTFAFVSPSTAPGAGTYTASIAFTPADTADYNTVPSTVSVLVDKATPAISAWPTVGTLTYGQTLAALTLTGGMASVAGTFSLDAPATAPNAGPYAASVTFTPADTADYNAVNAAISVVVDKATPAISAWPTAGGLTYGQTLADSTLSPGAASVDGTFAFTAPSTQPGAGTYPAAVTFTPTDTANYNTVSGPVPVAVSKATPEVSEWPTTISLTYGQTLADAGLSGGSASVDGAFACDAPATVPGAGTYTAAVTFTPADAADYNTVSGTVSVAVNKATPTISVWPTASEISYGQTFADSAVSGGTASVDGAFTFDAPTTAPGLGTYAAAVTFTPTDTADYNTVSGTVSVTVHKATPEVAPWPTAGAITYGQTLASSTLAGGTASVAGAFAFADSATAPAAGTYTAVVVFTPVDTANYTMVTGTVPVAVGKATPMVSAWPTADEIDYGQTLAEVTLSGGAASVSGTFAFDAPTTAPVLGTHAAAATFTPADTANQNSVAGSISVTVNKGTPLVSAWPTAGAIVYGQTLADAVLSGGAASVSGTFAFTTASIAPNAGAYTAELSFTPADTTDYNTVSGTASVAVNKAMPEVAEWPTAGPLTYGQTLADSALSGGAASVDGEFAFTTASIIPGAGTYTAELTFTPEDTANYATVTGAVSVAVGKAMPAVSAWPEAADISYGQTLAKSTLSGGAASVPGKFGFDAPATAPVAGAYTAAVTFTPTDAADYSTVSGTVSVTVNKATSTVSAWPTATSIVYGQTLTYSTLNGGTASVAGMFAFTTPSAMPGAGTYAAAVTFTPSDTANCGTVARVVPVVVNKATPVISVWPTAGAVIYGQTLTYSTLSGGTASAAGTFAFANPMTAPGAGTYAAAITFTPSDTTDYKTVTGTVSVAVGRATPVIFVWPTVDAMSYGQALASLRLSGGAASVTGTFTFNAPETAPNAGAYTAAVTFTPTDTADYLTMSGAVAVTVNMATPTVSAWPTAGAIIYGQTLAASTLGGGTASVDGTFAFTSPLMMPAVGTYSVEVAFTPADTVNYSTLSATVLVTVNVAAPVVSVWPVASAITHGQLLSRSTLTGGAASVDGKFRFASPATAPSAGTYSASVIFTPTDSTDYGAVLGTVPVVVGKATPTVSTWPAASVLGYGQVLASSALTGGAASVSGKFAFADNSISPATGTYSASVVFTPTDTSDYTTVSGTVPVTVSRARPSVSEWPVAGGISYGQTLSSSTLSGGAVAAAIEQLHGAVVMYSSAPVTGAFSFDQPSWIPGIGTYRAAVTFRPADTANYTSVAGGAANVAVGKGMPAVSAWPTAGALTYGQRLASSVLSGGVASVQGTFAFTAPETMPGAGTYAASVAFTPVDAANYNTASGTVSVAVRRATPWVSVWPSAGALAPGQTLASSALTGGAASVPGAFAFDAPATVPGEGAYSAAVTFTPADAANYDTVSGAVTVGVGELKTVPDVAGMVQAAAASAIAGAGLVVGTVTQAYHATVPSGNVISQSPVGGAQAVVNTAVDLTVSKGPVPTAEKPAVPANLRASAGVAGVVLTWSANAEPDLAGYNVYRGVGSGGAFTKVNGTTVTPTRFEDPVAVGQAYCYKVTAVTAGGMESDLTGSVCTDGTLVMWLQNVSAQPGEAVRIPFNITNANGIVPNGLDIDFRYDQALIDPASIVIERTAVTAAVNFTVNATEPGRVRISGVGDQQLVGEGHLFDLTAKMKASAPVAQCETNSYAVVKFYDAVPALMPCDYSDTGTLCVSPLCKQGDLNSDGAVDSADVIIALQIAAGLVVPQGCQTDAGDLNGDGVIDSADAIMMQRLAVGLPLNPPQPGAKRSFGDAGLTDSPFKANSRRQATVGLAEGFPGGVVDVPVTINDTTGVSGIELTVSYLWAFGGIAVDDVQPGSLTGDFLKEINKGNGYVRLALSRAQALAVGSGTVAVLRFAIPATAQPGTVLPVRLNAVGLKGQFGDSFSWYGDIQAVDGRVTVKANTYAVTVDSATGGNITLNPAQPTGGYTAGTTVTVTAVPDADHVFANWTGALGGNTNPAALVVDAPKVLGAVFTAKTSEGESEGEGEGETTSPASIEVAAQALINDFDAADTDHSGGLSEAEALAALPGLTHAQFAQLDANGDKQLTLDELNQVLNTAGCNCKKSSFTIDGLKGRLADLFLMGLALTSLLAIRGRRP